MTINCAERGLLLLRVRDEIRMTLAAYQTLYESSVAFGMRKALQAEAGKADLETKVRICDRVCKCVCVCARGRGRGLVGWTPRWAVNLEAPMACGFMCVCVCVISICSVATLAASGLRLIQVRDLESEKANLEAEVQKLKAKCGTYQQLVPAVCTCAVCTCVPVCIFGSLFFELAYLL